MTDQQSLQGASLVDRAGDRIGKVEAVYDDARTGRPAWALVNTGLFGTKRTFVPIGQVDTQGDDLRVPVEKAQVKDAPHIEADDTLSTAEEQALYRHYGIDWDTGGRDERSGRFDPGSRAAETTQAHEAPEPAAGQWWGRPDERPQQPAEPRPEEPEPQQPAETSAPADEASTAPSQDAPRLRPASRAAGASAAPEPAATPEPAASEPHREDERDDAGIRLRRRKVTEEVSVKVPVEREEIVVERVGRSDDPAAS